MDLSALLSGSLPTTNPIPSLVNYPTKGGNTSASSKNDPAGKGGEPQAGQPGQEGGKEAANAGNGRYQHLPIVVEVGDAPEDCP